MKPFLDFIPLIAFFIAVKMYDIVAGAGALLVATLIVYALHFFMQDKKLDKQQWFVLVLTIVFCGITVAFNNDYFIRIKSPIINGIFTFVLIVSALINKPLMKMALKQLFSLSDKGWNKLTLAWAGFFALMGFLHYYTAFHTSDSVWINFKFWGWIPIMVVFMIAQFVLLRKHLNPEMIEKAQEQQK